jgi:hypothetical protein
MSQRIEPMVILLTIYILLSLAHQTSLHLKLTQPFFFVNFTFKTSPITLDLPKINPNWSNYTHSYGCGPQFETMILSLNMRELVFLSRPGYPPPNAMTIPFARLEAPQRMG